MKEFIPWIIILAVLVPLFAIVGWYIIRPSTDLQFTAPQQLPDAQVGVPYVFSFCQPPLADTSDLCDSSATNPTGGNPIYHFQLDSGSGFPPFGLSLNLNGLLIGEPSIEDERTFTVCAVDQSASQRCATVSLRVLPQQNGGGGGGAGYIKVNIVGSGIVRSSDGVIYCPPTCEGYLTTEFPFLIAEEPEGWFLSGWDGTACFAPNCPLTPSELRSPLEVTATFTYIG